MTLIIMAKNHHAGKSTSPGQCSLEITVPSAPAELVAFARKRGILPQTSIGKPGDMWLTAQIAIMSLVVY